MIAVTFMVCAFTILSVSQLDPGHEVQYSDRGPFNLQSVTAAAESGALVGDLT